MCHTIFSGFFLHSRRWGAISPMNPGCLHPFLNGWNYIQESRTPLCQPHPPIQWSLAPVQSRWRGWKISEDRAGSIPSPSLFPSLDPPHTPSMKINYFFVIDHSVIKFLQCKIISTAQNLNYYMSLSEFVLVFIFNYNFCFSIPVLMGDFCSTYSTLLHLPPLRFHLSEEAGIYKWT